MGRNANNNGSLLRRVCAYETDLILLIRPPNQMHTGCRTLVFSKAVWRYKTVLVPAFPAVVLFVHARSSETGSLMHRYKVFSVFSAVKWFANVTQTTGLACIHNVHRYADARLKKPGM